MKAAVYSEVIVSHEVKAYRSAQRAKKRVYLRRRRA
jgi:hypothetical protein